MAWCICPWGIDTVNGSPSSFKTHKHKQCVVINKNAVAYKPPSVVETKACGEWVKTHMHEGAVDHALDGHMDG